MIGQSLQRKGQRCIMTVKDFRTNRTHLDLAQERVLPTSKTVSPTTLSRACAPKGALGVGS